MTTMEKTLPETLINASDFSIYSIREENIPLVRMALINYYNTMTLRHYEQKGTLMSPVTICLELPRKIKEMHAAHPALFERNPVPNSVEKLTSDLLAGGEVVTPPAPVGTTSTGKRSKPAGKRGPKSKTEKPDPEKDLKKQIANWTKDTQLVAEFAAYIKSDYDVVSTPETKFKDVLIDFTEKTGHQVGERWNARNETLCNELGIKHERLAAPGYSGLGTYYVFLKKKSNRGDETEKPVSTDFDAPM